MMGHPTEAGKNGWGQLFSVNTDNDSNQQQKPSENGKMNGERRGSGGGPRATNKDEARDATTMERSESNTSHNGSMRDLSFDMEQPWQRSLLRELEKIEKADDKHARPRPQGQKILLGHAQSGDYIVEYDDEDDDTTVMTDTSSSLPLRPQMIHRNEPRHSALFKDDDEYEIGALSSTDSSIDRLAMLDQSSPFHRPSRGGSVFTEGIRQGSSRGDAVGGAMGLARANALVEGDRLGYLKPSRLRLKPSEDESIQKSACMCIGGYNFLDFLLIPGTEVSETPSSSRHKKRRTSRTLHQSASRRGSVGSASRRGSVGSASRRGSVGSTLGRVTEEEAPSESIFGVFRDESTHPRD